MNSPDHVLHRHVSCKPPCFHAVVVFVPDLQHPPAGSKSNSRFARIGWISFCCLVLGGSSHES